MSQILDLLRDPKVTNICDTYSGEVDSVWLSGSRGDGSLHIDGGLSSEELLAAADFASGLVSMSLTLAEKRGSK